jgi:hypothetical protein
MKQPHKGRLAVGRDALWLRLASKALQALQTATSDANYAANIAVLARTFPSDLRRKRLILKYEERTPFIRSLIPASDPDAWAHL